jgi:hypothetical protein
MKDLKRCPFCDGIATIESREDDHIEQVRIKCSKCEVKTREFNGDDHIEKVIAFWNLRSEKIKEFLEKRRNLEQSNMVKEETERNGYFDINDLSGGNFDDAFTIGKECGEAEFIEELLSMIK